MSESLLLVLSNAADGRDDEFNAWYDSTHIPELLTVPGVVGAERYTLASVEGPEPAHRYLAVYRLDGDPAEVLAEFRRRAVSGEITMSDTLDLTTVSLTAWRPSAADSG